MSSDQTVINYRLPVNLEFVALALCDESDDTTFFIDLETGGIFSLPRPEDDDWERAGECFDHAIECGFSRTPWRFLPVSALGTGEKRQVVAAFAATLTDRAFAARLHEAARADKPLTAAAHALGDRPAELCAWRAHVGRAGAAAALAFLAEYEIGITPGPHPDWDDGPEVTSAVN